MTAQELTGALRKEGAAEVSLLESNPVNIEEQHFDFLGDGLYMRVKILGPYHPSVLHYVTAPGGKLYRLELGKAELERMRRDLKLEIKDPDMALRYAQWLLRVTEGPGLWLLSSPEDVPFQPVAATDAELTKRIEKAKKDIAPKISTPSARPESNGFAVTQEAVKDRDLVRYELTISPQGRYEIGKQTLAAQLPVVYLLGSH